MELQRADSGGFYHRTPKEPEELMTLESLPYEVGLRVCGFLSPKDLLSLALASSHTHALAADHSLWRERCLSKWRKPNLSPAIRTKIDLTSSTREINWKRFYFQKKGLEKRWTKEKYVIHKIPHEGTTVIQVLRTNKKIYEDDENEAEADMEEGEKNEDEEGWTAKSEGGENEDDAAAVVDPMQEVVPSPEAQHTKRRKSAKQGKAGGKKKGKPAETDSPSDASASVEEDGAGKAAAKKAAKEKEKKKGDGGKPEQPVAETVDRKQRKSGRKGKGGRRAANGIGGEELVDWGWDFVTGDDDGQVILWSGHEFKEKRTLSAHDFIWWLEVHSDTCITASTDCTAKVIDLNKMEVVRTLKGHPTALWCVDFSIEEDYVVSGGQHGDFVAWRLSDGEKLASHKFGSGLFDVRCVVTDLPIPRRRVRLAGEKRDSDDEADDAEGQQQQQEDQEAEAETDEPASRSSSKLSLSTSRDGGAKMQRLAICTAVSDVDFYLYDIDARQVIGAFTGHRATVTTVKRDGDLVLSGSDDKTIRVWDLATLKCLHTFSVGGIVYDIRLCENKLVAGVTGEQSSFLRVWDYVKRTQMMDIPVARVPRRIFSITVLPDRIYCSTNEHITVVDFRDVEGVEVMCKPKKSNRSRRGHDNCLLQ